MQQLGRVDGPLSGTVGPSFFQSVSENLFEAWSSPVVALLFCRFPFIIGFVPVPDFSFPLLEPV